MAAARAPYLTLPSVFLPPKVNPYRFQLFRILYPVPTLTPNIRQAVGSLTFAHELRLRFALTPWPAAYRCFSRSRDHDEAGPVLAEDEGRPGRLRRAGASLPRVLDDTYFKPYYFYSSNNSV